MGHRAESAQMEQPEMWNDLTGTRSCWGPLSVTWPATFLQPPDCTRVWLCLPVTYTAASIYKTALERWAAATFQSPLPKVERQQFMKRATRGRRARVQGTKSTKLKSAEIRNLYFSCKISCYGHKNRQCLIFNKAKRIICLRTKKKEGFMIHDWIWFS